jgi:NTP pyrophosphatase (non-canonical NTP hydrolase)
MNYDTPLQGGASGERLRATVCGSFRRDPDRLRQEFVDLQEAGCLILSPSDAEFVSEVEGFVFGRSDLGKETREIEARHLRAMEQADFVWLHCPDGYVGTSAAMELGFAQAVGLRVFARERPADLMLADLIEVCASPQTAVEVVERDLGDAPSHALVGLQRYYARAANWRGWAGESAGQTLELLKGEVSELEEELATAPHGEAVTLELADIQLYLVHLANVLGADLGDAVCAKERINDTRFRAASERMAA